MQPVSVTFGPVPSRRLGHSLGVNNIPAKTCSYGCVYCQVGRTTCMEIQPKTFYPPESILLDIEKKLEQSHRSGIPVDYVTFVSDGEPTLDIHLGQELRGVKRLGCKTAVISNASLIWRRGVQQALFEADWVSLKVDTAVNSVWRRINRPHGRLRLETILKGAVAFSESYSGTLAAETMLVSGLNDDEAGVTSTAAYLARLHPATAYLSVPTRPPAEPRVHPPDEIHLHRAYEIFHKELPEVAFNISYEGDNFRATGDAASDLLAITAVHPMREDAVRKFLKQAGEGEEILAGLVAQNRLTRIQYEGSTYYLHTLL